jgi:hypothetical protein
MLKFTNAGNTFYKVLAGWAGSYTHGASWKLNSGVEKVTRDGDWFEFAGHSGSVYRCHKNSYGLTAYTAGILDSFYKQIESEPDVRIECMDEDTTDFMSIDYANS